MSITIIREQEGELLQRISIETFEDIFADVSEAAGGQGKAPDPHDYFDLSLIACKAITITMYAKRKGWPLDNITARISHDASQEREGIYRLNAHLQFHGITDKAQLARLVEIGERCPIHRLMTKTRIDVETSAETIEA